MPKKAIFREIALERLSSPEQLDQLLQVTTPGGWVALAAVGLLLVAGLLWGVGGAIPTQINGRGILLAPGGIHDVQAPAPGVVVEVLVLPGDQIAAGQAVLLMLEEGRTSSSTVASRYTGRVLEVMVDNGDGVERGMPLLIVEAQTEGPPTLQALLYVQPADGKNIQPGMPVHISPSTVHREEYGFILGRVVSVGAFPATREGMLLTLGNEDLVRTLSYGGAPIAVEVELLLDPRTPSGFAWTSANGPPQQVGSGTLCDALITLGEQRPLTLVLGTLR